MANVSGTCPNAVATSRGRGFTCGMTPDQEFAALCEQWPGWHIWRGRDRGGQPSGWHATRRRGGRSVILDAPGPAALRQQLAAAVAVERVAA